MSVTVAMTVAVTVFVTVAVIMTVLVAVAVTVSQARGFESGTLSFAQGLIEGRRR